MGGIKIDPLNKKIETIFFLFQNYLTLLWKDTQNGIFLGKFSNEISIF